MLARCFKRWPLCKLHNVKPCFYGGREECAKLKASQHVVPPYGASRGSSPQEEVTLLSQGHASFERTSVLSNTQLDECSVFIFLCAEPLHSGNHTVLQRGQIRSLCIVCVPFPTSKSP